MKYGAFGTKIDFEFNDDMLNRKEDTGNSIKIPYYSMYIGQLAMMNQDNQFYMKGDKKYFECLQGDYNIDYCEYDHTASIKYPKPYQKHARHITAQITAYQRMNLFEQLIKMDYDEIIRVCVDGIYFYEHEFEIKNTFSDKSDKMTFENGSATCYLSHIIEKDYLDNQYVEDFLPTAEPRAFYQRELLMGAGGNGKTHQTLIDDGLINILYIAPSWKLATDKSMEYDQMDVQVFHNLTQQPNSHKYLNTYSTIVIDEASMITEYEKQFIFRNSDSKLIFCGDVGYQLPPIVERNRQDGNNTGKYYSDRIQAEMNHIEKMITEIDEHPDVVRKLEANLEKCEIIYEAIDANENHNIYLDEMSFEGFDKITLLDGFNYRYGDDEILTNDTTFLRKMIDKKINFKWTYDQIKAHYRHITIEELKLEYKKEDMIMCSENVYASYYTDMFKHIDKFRVEANYTDYKNGQILYEQVDKIKCELRHGFTISSCQGITVNDTLYIDTRKQKSLRMLYTAISRARKSTQIVFIKSDEELTNPFQKAVIYIIHNPNFNEVYIGSAVDFEQRIKSHKYALREKTHKNYNIKLYKFIRDNSDGHWTFDIVKKAPCNSYKELRIIEQLIINEYDKSILLNMAPAAAITNDEIILLTPIKKDINKIEEPIKAVKVKAAIKVLHKAADKIIKPKRPPSKDIYTPQTKQQCFNTPQEYEWHLQELQILKGNATWRADQKAIIKVDKHNPTIDTFFKHI